MLINYNFLHVHIIFSTVTVRFPQTPAAALENSIVQVTDGTILNATCRLLLIALLLYPYMLELCTYSFLSSVYIVKSLEFALANTEVSRVVHGTENLMEDQI